MIMSQLVRYGLVGMVINLAMYSVYLFITYLTLEPKTAMTLLYIIGASAGYNGHRKWSFSHGGGDAGTIIRYAAAHVSGFLLNLLILAVFVDRLGLPHQGVEAAAIITVAGFLFIAFKFFVFPMKDRQ